MFCIVCATFQWAIRERSWGFSSVCESLGLQVLGSWVVQSRSSCVRLSGSGNGVDGDDVNVM